MRSIQHIKTTLALTLALGAVAAPVASARFDLNPPPARQTASVSSPVSPNPDQQTVVTAGSRAVQSPGARVARDLAARDAAARATPVVSSPPAQIVKISQPSGFGWGDAGIGAGAMLGLVLVLLGSTLYVTHRRTARVVS